MPYAVKEVYYTLQGEGAQAGRAAVFLRFAGCNLWTGREEDRARAICKFCDTDFVGVDGPGGGKFATAEDLVAHISQYWPSGQGGRPYVVCTGGEPALQLDAELVNTLHQSGFEVAVETNGTLPLVEGIDWICVSPKAGAQLRILAGNELKLVYPQAEAAAQPAALEHLGFDHFFLQPLDDIAGIDHIPATVQYCLEHPRWRLSIQVHKVVGIE